MTSRRPHSFVSKMPFNRRPLNLGKIAIFLLITVTFAGAQSESAIYRFRGLGDGGVPMDGVVADTSGSLYGATSTGGISCPQTGRGCGVIFKLRPPTTVGGSWTKSVLYKFTGGNDGATPAGGLLMNPSTGKLYGAASLGGANNYGTIFELDPGTPWTQTVLHTFSRVDGETPNGFLQLVRGHIVGSTGNGGANRNGVVFSLTPPSSPGGAWTEHVLHSFFGPTDGLFPRSVVADATGTLYGSTNGSGSGLGGTVWKLTQAAGSGPWTLTVLRAFTGGTDGSSPLGIVLGKDGKLYGVTSFNGDLICRCGTVFQLVPPSGGTGPWTLNTLYTFRGGTDGAVPSNLVIDSSGIIYGLARSGGLVCQPAQDDGCGVVFTLTPPSVPGGSWTENVLYDFEGNGSSTGTDGLQPTGKPLFLNGNIYGVTLSGGGTNEGTVFELVP